MSSPQLARSRRFTGAVLAAAILAAAPAPHDHSLFESEGSAPEAVTSHNPLSRATHWHAVRGFLRPETCLACHWHRLSGRPALAQTTGLCPAEAAAALSTPVVARHRPVDARLSRAPPELL